MLKTGATNNLKDDFCCEFEKNSKNRLIKTPHNMAVF